MGRVSKNGESDVGVAIAIIWVFIGGYFLFRESRKLKRKVNLFLAEINGKEILKISEINCVCSTLGPRNISLLFRKCDLYLMQNYIVIIGKPISRFSKKLYEPDILSKDIAGLMTIFPIAIIDTINQMWLNKKGEFTIGFGTTVRTKVEICFKDLSQSQIEAIQKYL